MTGWLPDGAPEWHGRPVARAVADVVPRCRAVLVGVVRTVVVHHPRSGQGPVGPTSRGAAFDAWLDDGTGTVIVRWTGRVGVPGVRAGATLRVEGTVGDLGGRPVLVNPLYRFEADPGSGIPAGTADQEGSSVS